MPEQVKHSVDHQMGHMVRKAFALGSRFADEGLVGEGNVAKMAGFARR
jgi:hypothetical protein